MPIDKTALTAELARLRKGRAMRDPDLAPRLGPQTKNAFGIGEQDQGPVIRRKARALIMQRLRDRELQTAALGALALLPQTDQRLLRDREAYLARELSYNSRTVRRRVEEAIRELVSACAEAQQSFEPAPDGGDGFVVRTLWATLRLDLGRPQLHERRRIVVTAARLSSIVGRLTVPRSDLDQTQSELEVTAKSGVTLAELARSSPVDFEFTLRLPGALQYGDTYEYELVFAIPPDRPMRPHYVFQPLVSCDRFELTVHFDPRRLPGEVRLVDGVLPRGLDHLQPGSPELSPAATGMLRHTFVNLRQGLSYGVRWSPAKH